MLGPLYGNTVRTIGPNLIIRERLQLPTSNTMLLDRKNNLKKTYSSKVELLGMHFWHIVSMSMSMIKMGTGMPP